MAKPFDVTTKQLVELHPADWLAYAGLPPAPVDVVDADLFNRPGPSLIDAVASLASILHPGAVREPGPAAVATGPDRKDGR